MDKILFSLGITLLLSINVQGQNVVWQNDSVFGISTNSNQALDVPVATVARHFSFQARLTQAQLPIFEGNIQQLIVYYSNGSFSCMEKFNQVKIIDSVIDLELGKEALCSFQNLMRQSTLMIKLCLDEQTCFDVDTYQIGSAPSAVSVNQAHQAEVAYLVNQSYLSDYVYPNIKTRNNPAYSFIWSAPKQPYLESYHDRLGDDLSPLSRENRLKEMRNKGFITWNPGTQTNQPKVLRLEGSNGTQLHQVISVAHTQDWDGNLTVNQTLDVMGNTHIEGGNMRIKNSNMEVKSLGVEVKKGGMKAVGDAMITGHLNVRKSLSNELTSASQNEVRHQGMVSFKTENLEIQRDLHVNAKSLTSERVTIPHYTLTFNESSESPSLVRGKATFIIQSGSVNEDQEINVNIETRLLLQDGWIIKNYDENPSSDGNPSPKHDPLLHILHPTEITNTLTVYRELKLDGSLYMINGSEESAVLRTENNIVHVNPDLKYNEVHIQGSDVHFEGSVEFTQPMTNQTLGSDCTILPYKNSDDNKNIDGVFTIDCEGDDLEAVTVSALLRSVCGDGLVEFQEECDKGLDNQLERLNSYCQSGGEDCTQDCAVGSTYNEVEIRSEENIRECIRSRQADRFCRNNCRFAGCGDGIRDLKERCDDGNQEDNDSCDQTCRLVTHCKFGVFRQVVNTSSLVILDTSLEDGERKELELDEQLSESDHWESLGDTITGRLSCDRFNNSNPDSNHGAVELILKESRNVMIEVVGVQFEDEGSFDTVLYLKEDNCNEIDNVACDDDDGFGTQSIIGQFDDMNRPRGLLLNEGRYYAIVGGYSADDYGQAKIAIRMLCEDANRHIRTIYATDETNDTLISFNTQDPNIGSQGFVHTNCLEDLPQNFIQPNSPDFDVNIHNLNTGYGRNQVSIELILKEDTKVTVRAYSETNNPVMYIQRACDDQQLFTDGNSNTLFCDDNGAALDDLYTRAYSGSAYLEKDMPAGVYYVIIDGTSIQGAANNVLFQFAPITAN